MSGQDAKAERRSICETDSTTEFVETQFAPSFPGVFRSQGVMPRTGVQQRPPERPDCDGEFEIVEELGRGASGVVYLAHQTGLQRLVALKVTHNVGVEARTMASLEHRNVVQVFSETVSQDQKLRLICMQYVDGLTLADLLECLRGDDQPLDGQRVRCLVAAACRRSVSGNDDEHSRAGQAEDDSHVGIACAITEQLAQAMQHAHRHGVLHRDIKPANVLLNPAGQPLLADFSLSFQSQDDDSVSEEVFGGTLAYMAPEHLDALQPQSGVGREAVDERSDIYSLGLVFYELLTLKPPFTLPDLTGVEACRTLAEQRRQNVPRLTERDDGSQRALNWTLERCLAPQPEARFQDAGEVAEALKGCRRLAGINRRLPQSPGLKWLSKRPVLGCFLLGTLANMLAIIVGVLYAFSTPRVVADVSDACRAAICSWFAWHAAVGAVVMFLATFKTFGAHANTLLNGSPTDSELRRSRCDMIRGTRRIILMNFLVCSPGFFATPVILAVHDIQFRWSAIADYVGAYAVLMMIALALAYFAVELVVIRIAYPRLWGDCRRLPLVAAKELRPVPRRLRFFHAVVGLIPLVAAAGLILVGPESFAGSGYFTFRLLGVGLIVAGLVAFVSMGMVRSVIERTVRLFEGQLE